MPGSTTLAAWVDSIGKGSLQAFQDSFSGLTNVSLCLVDADAAPVTVASNRSLFCFHIESWNESRCAQQHRQFIERAMRDGAPIVETCYAGLVCFACPIIVDGEAIGAFFGGMVLEEGSSMADRIDMADYDVACLPRADIDHAVGLLSATLGLLRNEGGVRERPSDMAARELMSDFGLSVREAMVVERVVMGESNREISKALFISEKTVKTHLTSIFAKTSVSNRWELASVCRKYYGA